MSNFAGAIKVNGNPVTAAGVNADRLDVLINAGDYEVSTGSSNAYLLSLDSQIVAYEEGMIVKFKANFANTGPATINVNSLGAKSIKRVNGDDIFSGQIISDQLVQIIYDGTNFVLISNTISNGEIIVQTAGETINGATLPVPVYQDTTDGEWYAVDANDSTKLNYRGFAISDGTDGNTIVIQVSGKVSGFSGLSKGRYYVSDTAGVLSATPGTNEINVGLAISPSELLIIINDFCPSFITSAITTDTSGASSAKTANLTITTPRRARVIQFNLSLFHRLQTGANGTRYRTWLVTMDLIKQTVAYTLLAQLTTANITSPSLLTTNGVTSNQEDLLYKSVNTMSNSVFLIGDSGASPENGTPSTRINTITSNENEITINYSLNLVAIADPGGIAVSPVVILG